MPAKPQWLLRVPEIVAELSALDVPVVDRAIVERVFRLKRRQAINLLASFGGYQAGRTALVDRLSLLERLRRIAGTEEFGFERRRRERLTSLLERLRRERQAASVEISVPRQAARPSSPGFPQGVRLEPGRLTVEFAGAKDLLGKLYVLAQAAAADFAGFEAAASSAN